MDAIGLLPPGLGGNSGSPGGPIEIADVTGLQTALDGKAPSSHTHAISNVTELQTALDGKASASHSHAISDTTGLQTALDGKAATSHTHSARDITTGTFATARLGSGTADNTKFLRGDHTWAVPSGGGGIVGVSEKTADYTLLTADKDYLFRVNSASARQVTVDGSLDLPVGGMIHFSRAGTGEVTIVASGATVNSPSGLRLRARHSMATLVCVAADTYLLTGDTKV